MQRYIFDGIGTFNHFNWLIIAYIESWQRVILIQFPHKKNSRLQLWLVGMYFFHDQNLPNAYWNIIDYRNFIEKKAQAIFTKKFS